MSRIKVIKESSDAGSGMVYCLGFVGAIVYYWQQADTFWQFILGLLKAIVWPALVVYEVLSRFGM
jgi:hypothetical protein